MRRKIVKASGTIKLLPNFYFFRYYFEIRDICDYLDTTTDTITHRKTSSMSQFAPNNYEKCVCSVASEWIRGRCIKVEMKNRGIFWLNGDIWLQFTFDQHFWQDRFYRIIGIFVDLEHLYRIDGSECDLWKVFLLKSKLFFLKTPKLWFRKSKDNNRKWMLTYYELINLDKNGRFFVFWYNNHEFISILPERCDQHTFRI